MRRSMHNVALHVVCISVLKYEFRLSIRESYKLVGGVLCSMEQCQDWGAKSRYSFRNFGRGSR